MVRKCRAIAEIAVAAQVGVRTRARAALAKASESSETAAKRRKVTNASSQLKFSSSSSSPPYVQLRRQRRVVIAQEDSELPAQEEIVIRLAETENRCAVHASSGEASRSCCSSNGSSELEREAVEFVDLEDEGGEVERSTYCCSRERRETMPSCEVRAESDELESTARPTSTEEADSGRGSTAAKMPTAAELEEFFADAEKEIQKRFVEKYNYDIVKDEPLKEGRYEWVRLKAKKKEQTVE